MSDDLRNRFRSVLKEDNESSDDIFSIWDKQKKMQLEDKKISQELEEAKKRAKELKKTLRKHQLGEKKDSLLQSFNSVQSKINKTNTEKIIIKLRSTKRKKIAVLVALLAVVTPIVLGNIIGDRDKKATLGESSTKIPIEDELPRETPKDFTLLLPNGVDESEFDIVRISPDNSDPSYTYLDRFSEDSSIFRVTQQEVPEDFDLQKVATDFQATQIIQVDDIQIFHGYSEKGRIQSLFFVKKDNLFSIRSSEKFSDDLWASYVISLD